MCDFHSQLGSSSGKNSHSDDSEDSPIDLDSDLSSLESGHFDLLEDFRLVLH